MSAPIPLALIDGRASDRMARLFGAVSGSVQLAAKAFTATNGGEHFKM
jgi:hypothetical protein